jgi:dTDP-4-amino-4,6-dideoxygalactose transaminase
MDIATRYGLFVVEDNAQSHSARYNQKMTGSFGHINATSFYPGKNLGALGDGGAITTNMEEYASDAIVYRNYGSRKKYYNEVVGFNMRLDECQAAILSVKLRRVLEWTNQRNELASFYNELFEGIEEVVVPVCADNASHVYHLYVIQARNRDLLQDHLSKCGIGTLIHYPIPPHLQQACSTLGYVKGSFPIAEKLASSVLSLPLWPGMSYSDVEYVCSTIRSFYRS